MFGPGLHNFEIHAEKSSCARGWNALRAALHLQNLYKYLPSEDAVAQSFFHYNGNVYSLGRGIPLPSFLDEVEAKYKDVTVLATWINDQRGLDMNVLIGQCAEELVPESQNRGLATQFSWAFRWTFAKCQRARIGRKDNCLLSELD